MTHYEFVCDIKDADALSLIQWAVAFLDQLPEATEEGGTVVLTPGMIRAIKTAAETAPKGHPVPAD